MREKKLIVLTGPSGVGLKDIVADVLQGRDDIGTVLPVTSRKMKEGERDGVGFYFYDLDGWNEMKEAGDLLESTELAGNDYGTSRRLVMQQLKTGKHVLLSVEPERAEQVKSNMPEAFCFYVEPFDPEVLRMRYASSARNSFELTARMALAAEQRERSGYSDMRIDSGDPTAAVETIRCRIDSL